MANPGYVRSTDGSNADNGSTWALANADLAGAIADAAAGDRIWVSQAHAETGASAVSLTFPGTAAAPNEVFCGDDGAEPPTALATAGTVTTTSIGDLWVLGGFASIYGLTFTSGTSGLRTLGIGTGTSSGAGIPTGLVFEQCALRLGSGTSSGSKIMVGPTAQGTSAEGCLVRLKGCTLQLANAGQFVEVHQCRFEMTGGSLTLGTAPTTLFKSASGGRAEILLDGVDLNSLGANNLFDVSSDSQVTVNLRNCKLPSGVTIASGTVPGHGTWVVRAVNCDSSNTNYRYYYKDFCGEVFHEATVVRSGGASDGTTPVSRKMVSAANTKFWLPLASDPIVFWNETTGSSVTVTVEVVTDGVTLTDADAWVEAEYLGSGSYPVSSFASDRASDVLATPANQASSSATWTTTGLSSPTKQKLSVSFTPQSKGPVRVRVMLAKASTTMYFCPLVAPPSGRQWMTGGESYVNDPSAAGGSIEVSAPLSAVIAGRLAATPY